MQEGLVMYCVFTIYHITACYISLRFYFLPCYFLENRWFSCNWQGCQKVCNSVWVQLQKLLSILVNKR